MCKSDSIVAVIRAAGNKRELAEAQAKLACTLRLHPFSLSPAKVQPEWSKKLADCKLTADESRVLYSDKGGTFKGFYLPPPVLFEENAAFEYVKRFHPKTELVLTYGSLDGEPCWIARAGKAQAAHRYLACAVMQVVLA